MNRFLILATGVLAGFLMLPGCSEGPDRDVQYTLYVTHPTLEMLEGEVVQVTASPASQTFTWESSDPDVATVSDGLVTAIADGTCLIYVASSGGLKRTIPVDVEKFLTLDGIDVTYKTNPTPVTSLALTLGQTVELEAFPSPIRYHEKVSFIVTWTSSNTGVATVDRNTGTVKAIGAGNSVITVTVVDKPSVKLEIPVTVPEKAITGIQVTASSDLMIGYPVTITPVLLPADYSVKDASLVWDSDNKSVATVTNGNLVPISPGTAKISVWLNSNPTVKAEMTITVSHIVISRFTDAGSNLVHSKANLSKNGEITIKGIDAAAFEVAYNRDFMSYNPATQKITFIGETGEWDVFYSSKYNYFWVARMDDVAPACYWIVGASISCASVWHDDFRDEVWSTSNIRQMAYMRPIGDGKYQATIYINFPEPEGDTFAVFANRAWGGQVAGITLTSTPPGICLHPNVSDVWNNANFVPGHYRFIYDVTNKTFDFEKID